MISFDDRFLSYFAVFRNIMQQQKIGPKKEAAEEVKEAPTLIDKL